MGLLSAATLRKIALTTCTLAFLVIGGKLVSVQSADANSVATPGAVQIETVNTYEDVIRTRFADAKPKLHQKRYRDWSDVQHDRWCHKTYKSYSKRTGKYISETGKRVYCVSPGQVSET